MMKVKIASAALAAVIALSSTVASAQGNKRHPSYKSKNITQQDMSSATATQRSGATLQGGSAGAGSGGDG